MLAVMNKLISNFQFVFLTFFHLNPSSIWAQLPFCTAPESGKKESQKQAIQSENIARIAKAASHKLPGKSSLNVSFVCHVCPVCPVYKEVGGCASWEYYEVVHKQFEVYIRKLEVVHREIVGCLISYNLLV